MNPYVLIVDDEVDILEIHEMTVKSAYSLEVRTAISGKEALKVIRSLGIPSLIITDYQMSDGDGLFLYNSLKENSIQVPFIVCSANPLVQIQSSIGHVHIVTKPNIVMPMLEILEQILTKEPIPEFVPVKITHLMRVGRADYDYYLRLGDKNFVKAFNKGEPFSQADSEKYIRKSIYNLYISGEEAKEFIQNFENYLVLKGKSFASTVEDLEIGYDAIESVEAISRALGWSPECVEIAKKTVDLALRSISAETEIFEILKLKFNSLSRSYSDHVSKLALMSSALCMQIEPSSNSSQMKLAMASLLHDVAVDPEIYENIEEWNERAADPRDISPETVHYRNHPLEAAKIVSRMKSLPPDIDKIIIDHHENTSTSGFPRKIIASRVNHLTAIFIITEDLVNYVGDQKPNRKLIANFLREKEALYNVSRFKVIFSALKANFLK